MGYYEPKWSDEEQTMIGLMELSGYRVIADINKDFTAIAVIRPNAHDLFFKADTEYEALRKAFNHWNNHHETYA